MGHGVGRARQVAVAAREDEKGRPAAAARPDPGRRSACGTTHGAADAQEVDVAAHDEQRVRNAHLSRITHAGLVCPAVCPAQAGHARGNLRRAAAIPGRAVPGGNVTVSAGPDPAERRLRRPVPGVLRRQVLAVAPGAAGAVLVVPLTARDADHGLYSARWPGITAPRWPARSR